LNVPGAKHAMQLMKGLQIFIPERIFEQRLQVLADHAMVFPITVDIV
jgi:hypothetical protein